MPAYSVIITITEQKQKVFGKKQERATVIIEEEYSELKGKFECKRCGKKIPSNFDLLVSLRFIIVEDLSKKARQLQDKANPVVSALEEELTEKARQIESDVQADK